MKAMLFIQEKEEMLGPTEEVLPVRLVLQLRSHLVEELVSK